VFFSPVTSVPFVILIIQLVAVTAEWLVDSIEGVTETGHISKEFVGIILLPIVGNAAGMSSYCTSVLCSFFKFRSKNMQLLLLFLLRTSLISALVLLLVQVS